MQLHLRGKWYIKIFIWNIAIKSGENILPSLLSFFRNRKSNISWVQHKNDIFTSNWRSRCKRWEEKEADRAAAAADKASTHPNHNTTGKTGQAQRARGIICGTRRREGDGSESNCTGTGPPQRKRTQRARGRERKREKTGGKGGSGRERKRDRGCAERIRDRQSLKCWRCLCGQLGASSSDWPPRSGKAAPNNGRRLAWEAERKLKNCRRARRR